MLVNLLSYMKVCNMNGRLGLPIFIFSIMASAIIIGSAYVANYDSMLARPEGKLILLLLSINVVANVLQIIIAAIDLLGDHLGNLKREPRKKLDEIFYRIVNDLRIPYSNPPQNPKQEISDGPKQTEAID